MRRAFTLIELLIGIALGLVLIGTLYAGFRVASQTVTITERLALENKLLVGGYVAALEETDFWWSIDRPGHQPLRTRPPFNPISASFGYNTGGNDWERLPQPFTPFAQSWSASGAATPYASAWLANDPRTWYRGDAALPLRMETDRSPFGNYAIFQCASGGDVIVAPSPSTQAIALDAGQRWLPDQHVGLKYGLGFYGWLSYLPANALIDAYVLDGGRGRRIPELTSAQAMATNAATMAAQGHHGRFRKQLGSGSGGLLSGSERAVTRPFMLYTASCGIAGFAPGDTATTKRERAMINRQIAGALPGTERRSAFPILLASLAAPEPLVATAPSHWPVVTAEVRRVLIWGAMRTWCSVRVTDPISGKMTELSFPTIGTGLRGARLVRGLD